MSSRSPDGVFYLTTPIYYINAPPHLGHAYTTIAADTMCRYRRLAGDDVFFLTGTDEHGDKIAQAAAKAGEVPQTLADRNSKAFRTQWDALGITYDRFIRTTDPDHRTIVREVLQRLWDAGEIYFGKYGGQYCFGCERFYTEKEIVEGKCPDHQTPLTYIEEENYFFRMSKYQDWLRQELETHPDRVRPDRYRNELLGFLREPLQDLSISRPKSRLQWGIPLPFDDRFVTYVWFDALLNYVSGLGPLDGEQHRRFWPVVQHVIGKDILKPHGIYWPCMLKAAGLLRGAAGAVGLPDFARLHVHGYWTLGGGKISKSVGNVVEALRLADKYGRDAFRYFVLREMPFGLDANFTEEGFLERFNADLANDLGNLVSRATRLLWDAARTQPQTYTASAGDLRLLSDTMETTRAHVASAMDDFAFHRALAELWTFIGFLNGYVDQRQPWSLARNPHEQDQLRQVLAVLADALRFLGIMLEPFVPDAAEKIRDNIGYAGPLRLEEARCRADDPTVKYTVKHLRGLFPRRDRTDQVARPDAALPRAAPEDTAPPTSQRITIAEFQRLDLRVAEVLAAEAVPKSKKLLKLTVRLADETRTLVAGIAEHYRPEALVGRKVVVVANLEPATLMGVTSNGMVLAGSAGGALALLTLDQDLPPGAKVR
jgi:methionyl-tRNA synthetase